MMSLVGSSEFRYYGLLRRWLGVIVAAAGVGCESASEPAEVQQDPPQVVVYAYPDERGILSPVHLTATVTDAAGQPIPYTMVEWRVVSGGGFLGHWSGRFGRVDEGESISTVGNADGATSMTWGLGPVVGTQVLEVQPRDGEPVRIEVEASPGVILVGVWRPREPLPLPSDTIRIHATRVSDAEISEARERLDGGHLVQLSGAWPRVGPAIDTAWVFHIDPAFAKPIPGPRVSMTCISTIPLTDDELVAATNNETSFADGFCPDLIEIVGIEEVPNEYLSRLNP